MAKAIDRGLENREIVLGVLTEVLDKGNFVHLVLNQALSKYQYLEKPDRAFITRVTEGTLEYLLQIDYIINSYSKTKTEKMKPLIRNLLRMSVYQLLIHGPCARFRAVCNEAVKLAVTPPFSGAERLCERSFADHCQGIRKIWIFPVRPCVTAFRSGCTPCGKKTVGKEKAEKIAASFLEGTPCMGALQP